MRRRTPPVLVTLAWLALASLAFAQDREPPSPEDLDDRDPRRPRLALETGGHTLRVVKLFFTADGKELVSVGHDESVRTWDLKTGELRRVLRTQFSSKEQGQSQAALLGTGTLVLSGRFRSREGRKHPYVFLDVAGGRVERVLEVDSRGEGSLTLAVSRDGKYLAAGNWENAYVCEVATGKRVREVERADPFVITRSLAFTSDGRRLAVLMGNHLRVVRVAGRQQPPTTVLAKKGEVHSILWSRDDRHVLACTDQGVDVWDPQAGARVKSVALGKTNALAWDADRRLLLTAGSGPKGRRARVALVDVDAGTVVRSYRLPPGEAEEAFEVAASPDSKLIAAVAPEEVIHVWDRASGELLHTLGSRGHPVLAAGWGPGGQTVAWGGRLDPQGRDLATRQPLERAFDLSRLEFVRRPALKEFGRAVLQERGVKLHAANFPKVFRKGQTIDLDVPLGHCQAGTLLPGDRAALGMPDAGPVRLVETVKGKGAGRLLGHRGPVTDLAPSPAGRYLLTASRDQTLKVWNVAKPGDERLLLTLFVAGQDWVAWTPQGYYAASPGGERLMGWTVHNAVGQVAAFYPAEQFRRVLYRPDVIRRVLETGSVAAAVKAANAERVARNVEVPRAEADPEKLLPPVVAITVDASRKPTVTVRVEARQSCPEQPIKSLRLELDGRPLPPGQGYVAFPEGQEKARHQETWTVELPPGKHRLSVMARGKDDTPSWSNVAEVTAPLAAGKRPRLHHVAVGVSAYDREKLRLKYAHADAGRVARAFAASCEAGTLYRPGVGVGKPLLDREATRDAVLAAVEAVRRADSPPRPDDLFVFSFAGHGLRAEGEFFLLTREADPTDAGTLERTAVSGRALREALKDFPCQVLLLLDACYSGAFGAGPLARYQPGSDEAARALADVDLRVAVMCAALGHEEAVERDGQGLFTAAVVSALGRKGKVIFDEETGEMTVIDLQAFVSREVAKAARALDRRQTPYLKLPLAHPAFVVTQFPTD